MNKVKLNSEALKTIKQNGFNIAKYNEVFHL